MYTTGCSLFFNFIFLYSFLADSITKKGISKLPNIDLTVVVFPLPVIPHTNVCRAKSLYDNLYGIFINFRFPSHNIPICIPSLLSVIIGYNFPLFNSKLGTGSDGNVQINPNSSEVSIVHNGDSFNSSIIIFGTKIELFSDSLTVKL